MAVKEKSDAAALQRCASLGAFLSMANVSPAANGFFINFVDEDTTARFLELRGGLFDDAEQRARILRQAVENIFSEVPDEPEPIIEASIPDKRSRLRRALNILFGISPDDQEYVVEETRNW